MRGFSRRAPPFLLRLMLMASNEYCFMAHCVFHCTPYITNWLLSNDSRSIWLLLCHSLHPLCLNGVRWCHKSISRYRPFVALPIQINIDKNSINTDTVASAHLVSYNRPYADACVHVCIDSGEVCSVPLPSMAHGCVFVCVSPVRLLITSSVIWHDLKPIWLAKQVL